MANNLQNSNPNFFEGCEKLVEIWFAPNANADLRKIPRSHWDALLKSVRCEIISSTRNEQIDAYVLSESSMFVSKRRWILKTCGTTTPLQCLEPLLSMAFEIGGYSEVEDFFYSRKNYKRPDLQVSPHRGFEEEVSFLDQFFDEGRAYCLGSVNRECWYLYMMSRRGVGEVLVDELSLAQNMMVPDPDQTIEVLMTNLDPEIMAMFTKEMTADAKEATLKTGINKIIPGMIIDDYLFDPCGYSMNGVSKNIGKMYSEGCYMTIHITPEPEFSYVSFESNIAASSYSDLITRVIDTFKPGKFIVTVFANKTSPAYGASRELEHMANMGQFKRHDVQYCRFDTYDLTYAYYVKYPS